MTGYGHEKLTCLCDRCGTKDGGSDVESTELLELFCNSRSSFWRNGRRIDEDFALER